MAQVLLVDDENSIRVTLGAFLRDGGHRVHVAADADTARQILTDEGNIDVVVTDIILPRVSGVELLRAIRRASPHVQVVLVTGEPIVETAAEAVRAGAFDYLAKPVSKDTILRAVANAARVKALDDEKRRLEQENRAYQNDLARLVGERTAALRESEERFRLLVETMGDGLAVQENGRLTFVNDSFCEMLGYTRNELIGRQFATLFDRTNRAKLAEQSAMQKRGGRGSYMIEFTRKDGRKVTTLVSPPPIRREGRRGRGTFAVFTDITERKQLEERLRQGQKMESIGRLAGGVAHDFNNILTGILGYCGFLRDKLADNEAARDEVRQIRTLAKRAATLTRQLLAFSRRQPLAPVVLDLNDVVANAAKMLRRLIGENIDLQFNPAPDLGNAKVDPGQIEQVLMNLAVNARDAMPHGGKLTIETANVVLDEDYAARHGGAQAGPHVMVAVTDTGAGMDQETRERIFEPFFTTKEAGKGTGLGLATAYGIVKQHGGNIWVYSELDKGSTFKIYFPRVDDEANDLSSDTKFAVEPHGSEMILVVEDETSVRAIAQRALEMHGYTVLCAASAEEAETAFEEHRSDIALLLTDVVLPGRTGRELHETLVTERPDLKVLYMSGYTDNAIAHQGRLDPGVPFLEKPFGPEGLVRRVREVLAGDVGSG